MRLALIFLAFLLSLPLQAQEKLKFGLNWLPQTEHGGFFQALADGTYKKYGLDVEIIAGGPQVNNRLLLVAEKIDVFMGGNLFQAFSALENKVPTKVLAALFQKDPQALISHEGFAANFQDLKKGNLYISKIGQVTFFPFLKSLGFGEENLKPYSFNPAVFIGDEKAVLQAYVTSEPFAIEKLTGKKPRVWLLSDYGFSSPSTLLEVHEKNFENPKIKAFIEASIEGWVNFLKHDNSKAKALIQSLNSEIDDKKFSFAFSKLEALILNDFSKNNGIGAINPVQVQQFYETLKSVGAFKETLDPLKAIDARYVNKGFLKDKIQ